MYLIEQKGMKKWLLLLLLLPLVSCIRVEQLSYDGVESVQVKSVGGNRNEVDLFVRAANGSGSNISLVRAELTLHQQGRTLLKASVDEKVILPRKFDGTVRIPVTVRFEGGLLGALGVMGTLSRGLQGTTVSGVVQVKAGLIRKTYEVKEVETERFLRQFGINASDLIKQFEL